MANPARWRSANWQRGLVLRLFHRRLEPRVAALLCLQLFQHLLDLEFRVQSCGFHRVGNAAPSALLVKLHGPLETGRVGGPHDLVLNAFVLHGGQDTDRGRVPYTTSYPRPLHLGCSDRAIEAAVPHRLAQREPDWRDLRIRPPQLAANGRDADYIKMQLMAAQRRSANFELRENHAIARVQQQVWLTKRHLPIPPAEPYGFHTNDAGRSVSR